MDNSKDKLVKAITGRDEDFAQWYTDVCRKAELMDYTDAKGFIIYRPYGYAIWENIQSIWMPISGGRDTRTSTCRSSFRNPYS